MRRTSRFTVTLSKPLIALVALLTLSLATVSGCKKKSDEPKGDKPTAGSASGSGTAGSGTDSAAAERDKLNKAYAAAAKAFYTDYLERNPGSASNLGYHEFDGKLGDVSPDAIAADLETNKKALKTFSAFEGKIDNDYELQILIANIRGAIFETEVLRSPWRNPMGYPWALGMTRYISRDYAPIGTRAKAIIDTCTQAPKFFRASAEEPRKGPAQNNGPNGTSSGQRHHRFSQR